MTRTNNDSFFVILLRNLIYVIPCLQLLLLNNIVTVFQTGAMHELRKTIF